MTSFINPLEIAQKISQGSAILKGKSPVDIANACRVEPMCLVDERILHWTHLPVVMQTNLDLFTGYWAQAANALLNVTAIETMKVLDALNPNRDAANAFIGLGWDYLEKASTESLSAAAKDSYKCTLPSPVKLWGLDAYTKESNEKATINGQAQIDIKELKEVANLAVGKMFTIRSTTKVREGDKDVVVNEPMYVTVRLLPAPTGASTIVDILSLNAEDLSITHRIKLWNMGQIEFINGVILMQDVIDNHRKALLNDKNGHYREIMSRRRNATGAALATGRVSIGAASNIIITCEQTLKDFQRRTGLSFDDFKTRQNVFDETYAMIVTVIDPDWETVNVYVRDRKEVATYRIADLKSANRGSGADVTEIMKAFIQGNNARI